MIRAVIFDLYGTLIAPWPVNGNREMFTAHADTLGFGIDRFLDVWRADLAAREVGPLADSINRVYRSVTGAAPSVDLVDRLVEHRARTARECLANLRPDAHATLSAIRSRGMKIGLISDCSTDTASAWGEASIANLVDVPLFSAIEGIKKPDRHIFLRACERLGVAPESCLYVGDGGSDELPGADAVGMRVFQLRVGDGAEVEWSGPQVPSLTHILNYL